MFDDALIRRQTDLVEYAFIDQNDLIGHAEKETVDLAKRPWPPVTITVQGNDDLPAQYPA